YSEKSENCANNTGSKGILYGMWEGPSYQFLMVANHHKLLKTSFSRDVAPDIEWFLKQIR
ncbi:hypothetical protein K6U39_16610, partial [Vibrio parahaemolyticus]|nr:hypothetical protein [Vibrio parahaemolyticus]